MCAHDSCGFAIRGTAHTHTHTHTHTREPGTHTHTHTHTCTRENQAHTHTHTHTRTLPVFSLTFAAQRSPGDVAPWRPWAVLAGRPAEHQLPAQQCLGPAQTGVARQRQRVTVQVHLGRTHGNEDTYVFSRYVHVPQFANFCCAVPPFRCLMFRGNPVCSVPVF